MEIQDGFFHSEPLLGSLMGRGAVRIPTKSLTQDFPSSCIMKPTLFESAGVLMRFATTWENIVMEDKLKPAYLIS